MPKLSIIIPTHNRARYAIPTIRYLLEACNNIEIVVADTSDEDLIGPGLKDHPHYDRVCLVRPKHRPVSVVDNFNIGLAHSTGDYLIFLGDDDFVMPDINVVCDWAARNEIDAVKFNFPALYYWPDFAHKNEANRLGATLHITPYSGLVHPHDPKQALEEATRNFGAGVLNMPRAYAGMISRKLITNISEKYGDLFGGVSPDIYSSALISACSQKCVCLDYPVIIPGSSGSSTAGQSANGKHIGMLRDNPHIAAFSNLVWDNRIPEFYSVPTVWSYSLLKAIEKIKSPTLSLNYIRLYTKCFLYHRQYRSFTVKAYWFSIRQQHVANPLPKILSSLFLEGIWVAGKVWQLIRRRIKASPVMIIHNLQDVWSASHAIHHHVRNTPINLTDL